MNKTKYLLMFSIILFTGWMIFFQGTQPASSSPLMGFTLTPTDPVPTDTPVVPTNTPVIPTNTPAIPTNTPVVPTNTPVIPTNTPVVPTNTPGGPTSTPSGLTLTPTTPVVNTVPPPPEQTPFIIPVTGTDRTGSQEGLINLGLALVAFGLIAAGLKLRKQ
jgi:hypothetical protein